MKLQRYAMGASNSPIMAPRGTERGYAWMEPSPIGAYVCAFGVDRLVKVLEALADRVDSEVAYGDDWPEYQQAMALVGEWSKRA